MRHKTSNTANAFVAGSLVGLVLLLAGCEAPGEAEDTIDAQSIQVDLGPKSWTGTPTEAIESPPTFVLEISERDATLLGANGTTHSFIPEYGFSAAIGTRFINNYADIAEEGPCLNDEIIAIHVETGDTFVVTEAGHCIEDNWDYYVDDAWDYLDE